MNYHRHHHCLPQCHFKPKPKTNGGQSHCGPGPTSTCNFIQIAHSNRHRINRLNRPLLPSPYQAFLSPAPPLRQPTQPRYTTEEIMAHLAFVYTTLAEPALVSTRTISSFRGACKPPGYDNWKISNSKRMPRREVLSRWGAMRLGGRKALYNFGGHWGL